MRIILPLVLFLTACSGNSQPPVKKDTLILTPPVRKLVKDFPLNKDTTLTLWYAATGCTCAEWRTADNEEEFYYLEPANEQLMRSDTLLDGMSFPVQIRVTGQLITYLGYPKGLLPTKANPDPDNVFRYTKITLLQRHRMSQ